MIEKIRNYLLIITAQIIAVYSVPVISASTDVLNIDEIGSADISTLTEDTKVFNTIGMGIALSIAQCEGRATCDPTVDETEIGQLIETLDARIEGVVSRQQNNEEDMESILTAYVNTKEKYTDYMERLSEISRTAVPELPEEEIVEEDIFTDTGEEGMTEDEYSAFDDFDDSLFDDEELVDDEDLVDDEELEGFEDNTSLE